MIPDVHPPGPRAPAPRPLRPATTELVREAGLSDILVKLEAGERLTSQDGQDLFESPSLAAVGALANRVRERRHGDLCFFNRNLHINATNVCEASCIFCSFARLKTGDPAAWTMSIQQAVDRVAALRDVLVTEVHIVNGLNPDLSFDYYTDLVRALKTQRPDLHIKGFTAVEIHYYAHKYGMTCEQVLRALVDAGLQSMPGGGAEIFADRARKKLCDDKVDAEGWLDVHRVAHGMGMPTNCTMLFGSIETLAERVDHLVRLRALQDQSLAAGGAAFQTLIPLRFHNENNRLQRLRAPTGQDSLRTIAVSRLMLDNVPHVKAYWPMLGIRTAQLALLFGADDLDGTVREEHIYHMAGASTPQGLHRHELVRLIHHADRKPVERDTVYRVVRRDDPVQPDAFGDHHVPLPRVGAVGYANSWPLVRFLGEGGPVQVRTGHPGDVAAWLDQDEVDLALLPVGALLTSPGLRVVPDVCIGCDGPVHSVLLVAEAPPEDWTRVVLDGVSRTSVLLARLLLGEGPLAGRVSPDLEIVDAAPGSGVASATGTTAAVVIGDVARYLPDRLSTRLDLGQLWKDWTGLPFVFAVWAGHHDVHPAVVERVRAAGLSGLDRLDQAPEADRAYLRDSIRYPLDDAAMMGLRRFAALAHRAGLVPHDTIDLYPPRADLPPRPDADALQADLVAARAGPVLDSGALRRLLEAAPLMELAAVAHLRASDGSQPDLSATATYQVACRVPVTASEATVAAAVRALADVSGTRVDLVDRGAQASLATWCELATRLQRGGELRVVMAAAAPGLRQLAEAEGVAVAEIAARLAASGVDGLELVLATQDDSLEQLRGVAVDLDLVLLHGEGQPLATQAELLARAASAAQDSSHVRSLTVRSLQATRLAVPEADNTAVGWLRRTALARLAMPPEVAIVASPASEGLDAVQIGLTVGATSLGPLHHEELRLNGAADFTETLVEIERAIEDAGLRPARATARGVDTRPALGRAGRYRALPTTPPAT